MKKVLVMVIAMFSLCMFSACGSMQLSDEEITKNLEKNAEEHGFEITDIAYTYDEEGKDKSYGIGGAYWIDMTIKNDEKFSESSFALNLSKLSEDGGTITGENGYDYIVLYDNVTFNGKVYTIDPDNVVFDEDNNAIYDPTGKATGKAEPTTEATTSEDTMKKVKDDDLKIDIWVCAQDVAKQSLKSPKSADFCPFYEAEVYSLGNKQYMAMGYVDAENSYGAEIRTNFTVWLTKTKDGYKDGYAEFDE